MNLQCLHGFFIFTETASGQVSRFSSYTGLRVEPFSRGFTFPLLVNAPKYSLQGHLYLGFPAIKSFGGEPWDVMRENNIAYDFTLGLMRPIAATIAKTSIKIAGDRFIAPGLLMPGTIIPSGQRIAGYQAHWDQSGLKWTYSEVNYV